MFWGEIVNSLFNKFLGYTQHYLFWFEFSLISLNSKKNLALFEMNFNWCNNFLVFFNKEMLKNWASFGNFKIFSNAPLPEIEGNFPQPFPSKFPLPIETPIGCIISFYIIRNQ